MSTKITEKTITDVELEALLADDSKPLNGAGASDGKVEDVTPEAKAAEEAKAAAAKAAQDKEKEEASARENDRVRKLNDEKTAAEKRVKELEDEKAIQNSTDLEKFIASVQDEPSRNLLKTFGTLMQADMNKKFSPVLNKYEEERFESEFKQFSDKIPDLAAHKDEIKKQYMRNPSLAIKSLVGDTLLDIQTSKIKPIADDSSVANRGKVDISEASKDDLYDILETQKPPII